MTGQPTDGPEDPRAALVAYIEALRGLAVDLRECCLDVFADKADALADAVDAWLIAAPDDLMTEAQNLALAVEINCRRSALVRAVLGSQP